MLVQCPSCETTYRVADDLVTGQSPSFRCSRCRHVFALEAEPESKKPPAASSPGAPISNKETEIRGRNQPPSVAQPQPKEPSEDKRPQARQEKLFDLGLPQEPPAAEAPRQPAFSDVPGENLFPPREDFPPPGTRERPPSEAAEETAPGWSFPPPEGRESEGEAQPRTEPSLDADAAREAFSEFEENWERSYPSAEQEESAAVEEEQLASTIPYLTLFGVLLLLYAIATLVGQTRPSALDGLLKSVPWFGRSVFQNDHLRQGVVLESLQPSFQTILGNREVFVISGVAYNRNPVSVRGVQIEGQLYDGQGKEIGRQAVWVGSAMTPKIVKDLTAQEISILQQLSPQKRFEIPPQKGATFVIVFFRPRGEVKNFSCRVVAAEGAA